MSICNLDHFAESYWQDKKFVLVGGCFDPLHEGHLAYFAEARRLGNLVCAVQPTSAVAAKRTPCLPEMTRLKVLNACALVEHVTLATHGVAAVIDALKPSYYVVGSEYDGQLPSDEYDACVRNGTVVKYVECREQSSTTLLADYERRRNTEKLAAFERFVQGQKPAEKPWEPVTPFDYESRKAVEGPHAQIIKDTFSPIAVVDAGCGFGYLVQMLRDIGVDATGFDTSVPHKPYLCRGDLLDPDILGDFGMHPHPWGTSDLVICREVLEHLTARELAIAVRNLVTLSSRYVYVTTRFTAGSHLLDVDSRDDLDPTHQTMLNQSLLRALFVLEGCTRRPDLETALDWRKLNRVLVYETH